MAIELSVIVPCFNEEGNLPELVERTERVFDRRGIAGEIVLVNDGSRDGTGAQIETLAATRPHVIGVVGSSRVDLQACKLEYSIVSPK